MQKSICILTLYLSQLFLHRFRNELARSLTNGKKLSSLFINLSKEGQQRVIFFLNPISDSSWLTRCWESFPIALNAIDECQHSKRTLWPYFSGPT